MTPSLVDVNVLLALAWPNHQHHQSAHRWFSRLGKQGWATCAITELAFVRLSSNPAFTAEAVTPNEAAALLVRYKAHPGHAFVEHLPEIAVAGLENVIGHQQVNDAYLVRVAERKKMVFVTFDHRARAHAEKAQTVVVIGSDSVP